MSMCAGACRCCSCCCSRSHGGAGGGGGGAGGGCGPVKNSKNNTQAKFFREHHFRGHNVEVDFFRFSAQKKIRFFVGVCFDKIPVFV